MSSAPPTTLDAEAARCHRHRVGRRHLALLAALPIPSSGTPTLIGDAELCSDAAADPSPARVAACRSLLDREHPTPEAARELAASLPQTGLEPNAVTVLETALRLLPQENADSDAIEALTPQFVRRLVRHGWLQLVLGDHPQAEGLQAAVATASRPLPTRRYTSNDAAIEHVADAFGDTAWVLRSSRRSLMAVRPPQGYYLSNSTEELPKQWLSLRFPAGVDPTTDAAAFDRLLTARLLDGDDRVICSWTPESGFVADDQVWREVVPQPGGNNLATGILPPHIAVVGLHGDVHMLITAGGVLRPPAEPSQEAAERFLEQAAEQLTTPGRLDLLGQYLFRYVHDSPDPAHPQLFGTERIKGDIHQTAFESLATAAGGICRGDCDDLSELYQDIVTRQGKTAHVINLPSHAALAWSEQRDDAWHTFVMQTGPTLEFVDPELPRSLEQAYRHFDAGDIFDPNGLGLLLRFSGENQRSPWGLSYRIFSEPDYARTMIDVQRDWHFQTYYQGVRKMRELIAAGDEDTANYRELAGLFSFTGQYARAAEYLREAIERTEQASSRLFESSELVRHLMRAGEKEEAHRVVQRVLTEQLPRLREELGASAGRFGLRLASTLVDNGSSHFASQVLAETFMHHLAEEQWIEKISAWMGSDRFDPDLWNQLPLRHDLLTFAALTTSILDSEDPGLSQEDPFFGRQIALTQRWLDEMAFHDEHPFAIYTIAGQFYAAILGRERLHTMIDAAHTPDDGLVDHAERVGGATQIPLDLPWIKACPGYWLAGMQQLFHQRHDRFDRAAFDAHAAGFTRAIDLCRDLDLDPSRLPTQQYAGSLLIALVEQDGTSLRELLARLTEKNDKRMRDNAATWIGTAARFLPYAWFETVLELWVEEVDYKPKYFLIAWQAAINGADRHALAAAELAAERFADDPAFVAEYEYMRQILADEKDGTAE
ncbi:MAG: tetratricopeptide repeat protein [Planctomycetota bacterium]